MKEKCIYTTLQPNWLQAAAEASEKNPEVTMTFQSSKSWVTAQRLVKEQQSVIVFIRQSDDETPFRVSHCAELVAVRLKKEFEDSQSQRNWAEQQLWLQREWIENAWQRGEGENRRYDSWEKQFEEWEMGDNTQTWFTLRNVKPVTAFSITELLKAKDGMPLDGNYQRSYAICLTP